MGVLLVSPLGDARAFTVPFLKETIQWYRSGEIYHVVRLFIRADQEPFEGCRVVLETTITDAEDRTEVLASPDLLRMWKESYSDSHEDMTYSLDDYRFRPISVEVSFENVGIFGVVILKPSKPLQTTREGALLAVVFRASSQRAYSKMSLLLFGQISLDTYMLMPPTTVEVEKQPIPPRLKGRMVSWERNAVQVDRYELWIAVEGRLECGEVAASVVPKRNRLFQGESVFEEHYNLPPLRRGWELALDYRKDALHYNEAVHSTYRYQRFFMTLAWVFGAATLLSLALAILSLF